MGKCGFDNMADCVKECEYFYTCTRNPDYDELFKESEKVDIMAKCKYCEAEETKLVSLKKIKCSFNSRKMDMNVAAYINDPDDNMITLEIDSDYSDAIYSDSLRINYCPMCGRKLTACEDEKR